MNKKKLNYKYPNINDDKSFVGNSLTFYDEKFDSVVNYSYLRLKIFITNI